MVALYGEATCRDDERLSAYERVESVGKGLRSFSITCLL